MAGYIGTQAVSVNTTSATISDDLAVGDDATIAGTLGVTGVLTATSLDISGAIDVDGVSNLDVVDIDGAVNMATTLDASGVITVKHTDGVANVSLSPTSTGGVVNVRNSSGVGVITLDGRNSLVTVGNGLTLTDGDLTVASGHGINFAATANSSGATISELLDDYEEGRFVVTVTPGSGSITLANGTNGAFYTKIGRLVTIGARIDVSAVSSPSGQLYLTGLPFTGLFNHESAGLNAVTVIIFSPSANLEYNLCGEITSTHTTSILLRDKMGFTGGVQAIADKIDAGSLLAFTASYVAA